MSVEFDGIVLVIEDYYDDDIMWEFAVLYWYDDIYSVHLLLKEI